jgi:hypothetical protein
LRLDDEGFHPTVLVYWRNRIRTSPPATADLAGGPPGGGANRGAFGQHRRVLDSTSWRTRSPPRTPSAS